MIKSGEGINCYMDVFELTKGGNVSEVHLPKRVRGQTMRVSLRVLEGSQRGQRGTL